MTTTSVGSPRSLTEKSRLAKNTAISAAQKRTKERRKTQTCRVYDLKIQTNKLSATQRHALFMLFVEAKWLYNACVASPDVFTFAAGKTVTVKTRDGSLEDRDFAFLGSQMKQSVVDGIKSSVRTLATLKAKGKQVGRIRFTSEYRSLNLKQYGTTYRIRGSKVKVQNVPGWLRVNGVSQLDGHELANAKLVNTPDGYHLKVTAYLDTAQVVPQVFDHGSVVGIDMGVKTHVTVSDGRKFDVLVGETDRLKRLQRKLSRQQRGSNNYVRTKQLIRVEYQKMDGKKNHLAIQLVRQLTANETVVFQDENIASWKRKNGFVKAGKRLQHSVLGRVKQRLKDHPRAVMLGRFEPTTQRCVCGTKTPHHVRERTFVCSGCGVSEDRDVHAANMMIVLAREQKLIPENSCTSGTEGNACGVSVRRDDLRVGTHETMKQEAAKSLASR